jgi:opacity protein-like surface antigen
MRKITLAVMVMLTMAGIVSAQQMSIGGSLGLYMPLGDFGDMAGMGFGVLPQFEYQLNEKVNITGTIGYVSWGGKDIEYQAYDYVNDVYYTEKWEYSISNIPILAGAKYYFGQGKTKPYGMATAGLNMFSVSTTIFGMEVSASETYFGFGVGGGMEMPLNEKMNLDFNASYETIASEGESSNDLVFRAGIKYLLK